MVVQTLHWSVSRLLGLAVASHPSGGLAGGVPPRWKCVPMESGFRGGKSLDQTIQWTCLELSRLASALFSLVLA